MSGAPRDSRRSGQVALFTHEEPRNTTEAIAAAAAAADAVGCELVLAHGELGPLPAELPGLTLADAPPERPDLCLTLGGDGTILRALRHYTGTGVPVFGINYGTVGFLASVEASELESGLERAFAGEFETVSLPGLELETEGRTAVAVNDVSFTRSAHERVAELSYSVSGQEVGRVRCDGLVAATPVGSTGYNLANNGPVLAWGVEGFVVSFIAPHTLTARALVVAPHDVLHVINEGDRNIVEIGVDGTSAGRLGPGEEISVRFRDGLSVLAQLEGENFYRRMREKFGKLAH
ncbi:MAG: NAD(+)/NADH kinase [Solirubrobacterales bacterium]|nr:NAD(+)/NADH kinase [Solirubrobacterales bacterium]MCB8969971.1 NAD(+)/NADH kinase [Thermoleophilales bacterium]